MPNSDDASLIAVGSELLEVRSKKKKQLIKGFVVKPSVRDERLGTLGVVKLEERRRKWIH
jgi:hypothetical protein